MSLIINKKENMLMLWNNTQSKGYLNLIKLQPISKAFTISLCLIGAAALIAASISAWSILGHIPQALHFINALSTLQLGGPIGFGAAGITLLVGAVLYYKFKYLKHNENAKDAKDILENKRCEIFNDIEKKINANEMIVFREDEHKYLCITKGKAEYLTFTQLGEKKLPSKSAKEIAKR